MEVETHSLSNFDLKLKPPFSFPTNIGNGDSELYNRSSEMPELPPNEAPDCDDFGSSVTLNGDAESPTSGERKCDRVNGDSVLVRNDESPAPDLRECVTADFAAKTPPCTVETSAMKVQKVYRSYRTRRMLADSAVVAEELWWQAIDYVRLNHSTVSFFDYSKPETVPSRWNRVILNASKVGKGLSKDAKAQKLAFQHWIEAIDPRHRYGHSLHLYYEQWCNTASGQPFFYWLDIGDGKEVDLEECPRSKLRQQSIKYLGPLEREHYEYVVVEGKIRHKQTGILLDTNRGMPKAKWIFVMSTSEKLYAGEKKKGVFHHSSFLAGGATLAAGRLVAECGTLKAISAYSGHYRPTEDRLDSLLSFLREKGVNLDQVQVDKGNEDYENYGEMKSNQNGSSAELSTKSEREHEPEIFKEEEEEEKRDHICEELVPKSEGNKNYKRTLSGGLQSPKGVDDNEEVPKKAILERINSKKKMGTMWSSSYQLGHQLSLKWTTGAGPRIGCVADYPIQLRMQALAYVNLSPRSRFGPPSPSWRWAGGGGGGGGAPESPATIYESPKASSEANSCKGD